MVIQHLAMVSVGPVLRLTVSITMLVVLANSPSAQVWQPAQPLPVTGRSVAFDTLNGSAVLFGGSIYRGLGIPAVMPTDTWRFGARGFERITPAVSPPGRVGAALVFDSRRGVTVLSGGNDQNNLQRRDTWEFDGTAWVQRVTSTLAPGHFEAGAVFDTVRGVVVVYVPAQPSDQLWEYDGVDWLRRNPPVMPPNRGRPALAFDTVRSRTVLFGGSSASGYSDETWEYDGVTWLQQSPASSPPPRSGAAMTYDPLRQRTVLFGGMGIGPPAETWEYDGTTWTAVPTVLQPEDLSGRELVFDTVRQEPLLFAERAVASAAPQSTVVHRFSQQVWWPIQGTDTPIQRYRHRLVHDGRRDRTLLFGGSQVLSVIGSVAFADLWSWNGSSWTPISPLLGPSARAGHGFAYDIARDRAVLFGGTTSNGWNGDTWEFDGAGWLRRQLVVAPPPRTSMAMAYDPARQRVAMFGGEAGNLLADLWYYDGQAWSAQNLAGAPVARAGAVMVYDSANDRLVVFGGRTAAGVVAEAWSLDDHGWSPITSTGGPSPRTEAAIGYDAQSGSVVVVGGHSGTAPLADAWRLQAGNWTPLPAAGSVPRYGAAMTGQPGSGGCLLFGGAQVAPLFGTLVLELPMSDTWRYQPPAVATAVRSGRGCAGSTGVPSLAPAAGSVPGLGTTFLLEVGNLPTNGLAFLTVGSTMQSGGPHLPVDLSPYGMPGCLLWVGADATQAAAAANGRAGFALPIPAAAVLAGRHFAAQALSLDAAASAGGLATSNALFATVY